VDHKKKQLRSGVFLIDQLDADIDASAMAIIELKLVHSRAQALKPGPWRQKWDVEYFLKALEEIYAISDVDKFAKAEGVWRAVVTEFQKTLRVDVSDAGALSLSFTAVLVETNQKHPLPATSEDYVLKYLPRVFTASSNPYGKTDTNKAFTTELEADLRADKEYSEGWSLQGFMRVCEGLIFKWQKAHYDEVVRSGKRKDTDMDSDKSKKQRAGTSSSVVKAGEYCEGCGKQRHNTRQWSQ